MMSNSEAAFREHLKETRDHTERIEALLVARGARPSIVKDAALKAGGLKLREAAGLQKEPTGEVAS